MIECGLEITGVDSTWSRMEIEITARRPSRAGRMADAKAVESRRSLIKDALVRLLKSDAAAGDGRRGESSFCLYASPVRVAASPPLGTRVSLARYSGHRSNATRPGSVFCATAYLVIWATR